MLITSLPSSSESAMVSIRPCDTFVVSAIRGLSVPHNLSTGVTDSRLFSLGSLALALGESPLGHVPLAEGMAHVV